MNDLLNVLKDASEEAKARSLRAMDALQLDSLNFWLLEECQQKEEEYEAIRHRYRCERRYQKVVEAYGQLSPQAGRWYRMSTAAIAAETAIFRKRS